LAEVVKLIEKDELRHMSGLSLLSSYCKSIGHKATWLDSLVIKVFLFVLVIDVNMSRWALHNSEVRKHVQMIGLDPNCLTAGAYQAAREVHERIIQKEVLC
jgi:hypothetical protein